MLKTVILQCRSKGKADKRISDREDCSKVLNTPDILCNLLAITSRYLLRKAARIRVSHLCHQVGLLQIGVARCARPWTRPCSLCRVSASASNSVGQTGDAAKCVLKEEVIDLSRVWQGLLYQLNCPGVIPEHLGTKLSLSNFCCLTFVRHL